jgi:hypothetical protein
MMVFPFVRFFKQCASVICQTFYVPTRKGSVGYTNGFFRDRNDGARGIDMGDLLSLDETQALLISIVANFRLICTWSNLATVSIHTQGPSSHFVFQGRPQNMLSPLKR